MRSSSSRLNVYHALATRLLYLGNCRYPNSVIASNIIQSTAIVPDECIMETIHAILTYASGTLLTKRDIHLGLDRGFKEGTGIRNNSYAIILVSPFLFHFHPLL